MNIQKKIESNRVRKLKAQIKQAYKLNDAQFNYYWNRPNEKLDGLSPRQASVIPEKLEFLEGLYRFAVKRKLIKKRG